MTKATVNRHLLSGFFAIGSSRRSIPATGMVASAVLEVSSGPGVFDVEFVVMDSLEAASTKKTHVGAMP